jgi:hypothetical protein
MEAGGMKIRLLAVAMMASFITGCENETMDTQKLQPNTEEYILAHGIARGQPNELRIGGTLFRFPAGVGLNPYTATGIAVVANSGDGIPIAKEPRKIVKGKADSVTLFLDGDNAFRPRLDAAGTRGTGSTISVRLSSGYREYPSKDKISTQKAILRHQREIQKSGLVEYIFADRKNPGDAHLLYLAKGTTTPMGNRLIIDCEPRYDTKEGFVDFPAYCAVTYQSLQGFVVTYGFDGEIWLPRWQEIHRAVTHFVDSVVVK